MVAAFLASTQSEKARLIRDVSAFGSHLPRGGQALKSGFLSYAERVKRVRDPKL
jgi:hypothetical protein